MAKSKAYTILSFITILKCCLFFQECVGIAFKAEDMDSVLVSWDHVYDLNDDFRVLWTHNNQDILFEIQVRTLGYVGFGFSPDGQIAGADIAIGWVDSGHTFFQDRFVPHDSSSEPLVDPSQDYILIMGYENTTHTVIRFSRKLQTCDDAHDLPITNNTMRIMYMYSDEDPKDGSVSAGSLPHTLDAWRPARSFFLTQRHKSQVLLNERNRIMELRNQQVELPYDDDSLIWCKTFKLNKLEQKHHITRYEPIFDSSWSIHYLQHITLYECQDQSIELEEMSRESGRVCLGARSMSPACNAIVASWTRGSEGFTFPSEAGYPIESTTKYYLMETQYHNLNVNLQQLQFNKLFDNSGIRLHFTDRLRKHDVGVLSIGIDPNWRHIIPPGQTRIVSEGQCMGECTAYAFPPQGINIFAVMMRTHQIGREVKLRQIRKNEELPPIVHDRNIDPAYQDFRHLSESAHTLPGDRLVAECIYDSSKRSAITLGGLSMKEESCIVFTLYYPRQNKLTTCHSLPSLPTVLHSLGIEQLATNSNPILISSPPELSGMTLETRLLSYNWQNQFERFQQVTLQGTFKPICWGARNEILPISKNLVGHNIRHIQKYKEPRLCKPKRLFVRPQVQQPVVHVIQNNHIPEGSARSSRSSFIETPLALSSATTKTIFSNSHLILLLILSTLR